MTKKFNVIRTGGSVGEISNAMRYSSWDAKNGGTIVQTFENKDEAKDFAKALRSWLTPGERRYYKMSYKTVEVK
jgi:hypothetical protein